MGPSCDYVTEENRESWQRFVENKIREVMKPEAMESLEFKECVRYVQEEKRKREEYERRQAMHSICWNVLHGYTVKT